MAIKKQPKNELRSAEYKLSNDENLLENICGKYSVSPCFMRQNW